MDPELKIKQSRKIMNIKETNTEVQQQILVEQYYNKIILNQANNM